MLLPLYVLTLLAHPSHQVMLDLFLPGELLGHALSSIGLLLVFYGVYFGVLGRDLSELCTDKMAQTIGVRCHHTSSPILRIEFGLNSRRASNPDVHESLPRIWVSIPLNSHFPSLPGTHTRLQFTGRRDELPSRAINTKLCGICGGSLAPIRADPEKVEPTYEISCGHVSDIGSDFKSSAHFYFPLC